MKIMNKKQGVNHFPKDDSGLCLCFSLSYGHCLCTNIRRAHYRPALLLRVLRLYIVLWL